MSEKCMGNSHQLHVSSSEISSDIGWEYVTNAQNTIIERKYTISEIIN
jgi:hypothetical protein